MLSSLPVFDFWLTLSPHQSSIIYISSLAIVPSAREWSEAAHRPTTLSAKQSIRLLLSTQSPTQQRPRWRSSQQITSRVAVRRLPYLLYLSHNTSLANTLAEPKSAEWENWSPGSLRHKELVGLTWVAGSWKPHCPKQIRLTISE